MGKGRPEGRPALLGVLRSVNGFEIAGGADIVGSNIHESLSRVWLPEAVFPGNGAVAGSEACDWSDMPAVAGAFATASCILA